jgi:general L-amino acid transport system permease protein
MTTISRTTAGVPGAPPPRRDVGQEIRTWATEELWPSPLRAIINLLLVVLAVAVFRGQLASAPNVAVAVGTVWLLGLLWVTISALRHRYDVLAQWLKDRLFNSPSAALLTLIILLWLIAAVRGLVNWAILDASFSAVPQAAAAREHTGATWGVIIANLKLFLTGQYPRLQLWRVWTAAGLVAALIVVSVPVYGPLRRRLKAVRRPLTWLWLLSPIVIWALLRGVGAGPLPVVETRFWGGLLLTMVITVFALVLSFPLGVLLALGRRSSLPGIPAWLTFTVVGLVALWGLLNYTLPSLPLARTTLEYVIISWPLLLVAAAVLFQRVYRGNVVAATSTVYIEFVRGVPLITVLFMAQLMLPLFLPPNIIIENAYRAMWGFMFFSAAYLAENVRGGLQSISRGQYEAADALGLNTFQQLRHVILPQALRVVIPPMTGQFIGLFKDTSLVAIVGLFDLLNIANAVISQPDWLGLRRESYLFVTIIYYVGCYAIAAMGSWLERRAGLGVR